MSSRRHPKGEEGGERHLLFMEHKELYHSTLQFESLPYNTKGKILTHVSKP